jgi:hypothetical protein
VVVVREKLESLDRLFEKKKINECDFLKVDCEGCEYKLLLSSSKKTLNRIRKISMEVHFFNDEHYELYGKLVGRLRKTGFILEESENPVHKNLRFLRARCSESVSFVN